MLGGTRICLVLAALCAGSALTMSHVAAAAAGAAAAPKGPARSRSLPNAQRQLPNGLTVIVEEDHHAPLVAMQMRFVIDGGGAPFDAGLAALAANMMIDHTQHVPAGAYLSQMERVGVTAWSGSNSEYVYRSANAPTTALGTVLWAWSDQMGFFMSAADQAQLDRQRDLLEAQRRQRVDNVPYANLYGIAAQHMFPDGHPYRSTAFAGASASFSLRDLAGFFDQHFGPESAVIVMSGDVNAEATIQEVTKYFGPIPRGNARHELTTTPELLGEIRVDVGAAVQSSLVNMTWLTPRFYSDEDANMDTLARVLAGKGMALLDWKLTDGLHLTSSIAVRQDSRRLGSIFEIRAVVAPGHTPDEVITGIDDVLDDLRRTPVAPHLFNRALLDVVLPRTFAQDVAITRASNLGSMWMVMAAGYQQPQDLERYERVTPQTALQSVVRYLPKERRVVMVVTPDPQAPPGGVEVTSRLIPATGSQAPSVPSQP
jgi:zinc protease